MHLHDITTGLRTGWDNFQGWLDASKKNVGQLYLAVNTSHDLDAAIV